MTTFGEVVDRWHQNPSGENTAALRDAIVSAPSDPQALSEATDLLARADFDGARDRMLRAMPGWFLSPAAHNLLALAHDGAGNHDAAADERGLSGLGLRTILDSGDGTRFRPWIVLRVSDEYDLCALQQRDVVGQSTPDGYLDELRCADGSSLWFRLHRPRLAGAA